MITFFLRSQIPEPLVNAVEPDQDTPWLHSLLAKCIETAL